MPVDTPANFVYLETSRLQPAPFLKTLFPAGRDWPLLRESVAQHGYQSELPVVVRPRLVGEGFEIIDGVGRVTLAREFGVERISALVRVFEDEQARRFAVDSNLYLANTQVPVKLVPALVLAIEHERSGGVYRVERILEVTGVASATYKRAKASLNFAVERLRKTHPELESSTEAEVVAACLERQLWPEFAQFYSGELEPYGFYKRVYGESPQGKARRKKSPTGDGDQAPTSDATASKTEQAVGGKDEKKTVVDTFNALFTIAKENYFVKHVSEEPALHDALNSWDGDLEEIVPYLESLTQYLRQRMRGHREGVKKTRPQNPRQIRINEAIPQLI
jgi:hypothetical protein